MSGLDFQEELAKQIFALSQEKAFLERKLAELTAIKLLARFGLIETGVKEIETSEASEIDMDALMREMKNVQSH